MELITLDNLDKTRLIEGVLVYPLKVNRDESGVLIETLRSDWNGIYGKGREFAMQYFSVTNPGVARDEDLWHLHHLQEDRFLAAYGEIVVAIADQRENSSTKGMLNLFYIKAFDKPYIVLIPKGTLHGFLVVSKNEAVLLNFPTALYNPKDELRVHHKDANVNLPNGELFTWNRVREKFHLNG